MVEGTERKVFQRAERLCCLVNPVQKCSQCMRRCCVEHVRYIMRAASLDYIGYICDECLYEYLLTVPVIGILKNKNETNCQ